MSSLVSSFPVSLAVSVPRLCSRYAADIINFQDSATPASNCTSPASSAASTAVNTPADEVLRSLGDVGVYDAALDDDEASDDDQGATPKPLFAKGFRKPTQPFRYDLVLPKVRTTCCVLPQHLLMPAVCR